MMRGALQEDDYYKGQAVEIRGTHGGREFWKSGKIHRRTSKGYEVIFAEGNQAPQHILFRDIRPAQPTERAHAPKIATPLLTSADIDRINAEAEAKAKREAEAKALEQAKQPQPQTLVLLREPKKEPDAVAEKKRAERRAHVHAPTPLSNYLRDARLRKGLGQTETSVRCGFTRFRLSPIELGDSMPDDDELLALASELGLDLDHLLRLRDNPEQQANAQADIAPQLLALSQQVSELQQENLRLLERLERAAEAAAHAPRWQAPPANSPDLAQLREENATLRRAVIFYASLER